MKSENYTSWTLYELLTMRFLPRHGTLGEIFEMLKLVTGAFCCFSSCRAMKNCHVTSRIWIQVERHRIKKKCNINQRFTSRNNSKRSQRTAMSEQSQLTMLQNLINENNQWMKECRYQAT